VVHHAVRVLGWVCTGGSSGSGSGNAGSNNTHTPSTATSMSVLEQLSVVEFKQVIRLSVQSVVAVLVSMYIGGVGEGRGGGKMQKSVSSRSGSSNSSSDSSGSNSTHTGSDSDIDIDSNSGIYDLCDGLKLLGLKLPPSPYTGAHTNNTSHNTNTTYSSNKYNIKSEPGAGPGAGPGPGHTSECIVFYCDMLECCIIRAMFDICYYKADNCLLNIQSRVFCPTGKTLYGSIMSCDGIVHPLRLCWLFYGQLYIDMLLLKCKVEM